MGVISNREQPGSIQAKSLRFFRRLVSCSHGSVKVARGGRRGEKHIPSALLSLAQGHPAMLETGAHDSDLRHELYQGVWCHEQP